LQSSSTNRRWRRPLQQRQHRLADELALHQLRGDAREFADAAAPLDHRLELLAGSGDEILRAATELFASDSLTPRERPYWQGSRPQSRCPLMTKRPDCTASSTGDQRSVNEIDFFAGMSALDFEINPPATSTASTVSAMMERI
jgi:hypothetical protein